VQKLKLFHSSYFRKVFFLITLVIVLGQGAVFYLISKQLNATLFDREVQNLKDRLVLFESQALRVLKEDGPEEPTSIFPDKSLLSDIRYSIIAKRGEMIADSHVLIETLATGFALPEVQQALKNDFGYDQRFSEIFQDDIISVARVVRSHGEIVGAIKADLPLTIIKKTVLDVQKKIGLTSLGSLLFLTIVIYFLSKSFTEPLEALSIACDELARGNYYEKVPVTSSDEFGRLAMTLNRLGDDLIVRVTQAQDEKVKLKAMLQGLKEGIVAIDSQSRILFTNQAAYQLLDTDETDCRGKTLTEASGFRVLVDIAIEVLSKKIPTHIEIKEKERYLFINATPFEGEDGLGAMLVLQDRTELRRLEALRRDFVANVSHELKTPLTSIRGYVETLLEYGVSDETLLKRFLGKIDHNAQRLFNLVGDILSLAKVESLSGKMQTDPCDWLFIVNQIVARHESGILRKKLNFHLSSPAIHPVVQGEMEAMGQVFENLLSNAIRYTPDGGQIDVKFHFSPNEIILEVCDTGLGIPSQEQERIFERFYRVDKARSREIGGTGLGLSIVKHLVNEMGGRIWLESFPGLGSRFYVGLRRTF